MGAGYENLRTAGGVADFDNIDLYSAAFLQFLALDLLVCRHNSLGIFAVGADLDGETAVFGIDAGNSAGEDLVLFVVELLVYDAALCLTDSLNDNLLCSLSGNASELLGVNGDLYGTADLGSLGNGLCSIKIELSCGVFDLLNNFHLDIHIDLLLFFVHIYDNIVSSIGIILAESCHHCLMDLVIHILSGNALFLLESFNGNKKFSVHLSILLKTCILC